MTDEIAALHEAIDSKDKEIAALKAQLASSQLWCAKCGDALDDESVCQQCYWTLESAYDQVEKKMDEWLEAQKGNWILAGINDSVTDWAATIVQDEGVLYVNLYGETLPVHLPGYIRLMRHVYNGGSEG